MHVKFRYHPEAAVGGYSSVDVTVEFFLRIRTLLAADQTILDLGAGRGAWVDEIGMPPLKRELLDLRGDGRKLVGLDVDSVVKSNPLLDEAFVLASSGSTFPFEDNSFDLVLSDWTFEHLADPGATARELARVLKPGGWLCARTPNKAGYISIANRFIPTVLHSRVLRRVQPQRKDEDVFPTFYRINTINKARRVLEEHFRVVAYTHHPEPAYFAGSRVGWGLIKVAERLTPRRMGAVLLIFAQRKAK